MTTQNSPVVDADSHVFEPLSIWDSYLDREYRVIARSSLYYYQDDTGEIGLVVNGRQAPPMNRGKLNRQAIWRPGMTPEQIGSLDPSRPYPINPGSQNAEQRLLDMQTMGVDKAVLFPTLFAEYFPVVENPDVAGALSRAYNDWIYDFCRRDPARLFPMAVLPLQDVILAVREARRIAALGFKGCFLRPSFTSRRFLNHSYYDPLWTELQKLGLAACVHPSVGSTNPEWTSEGASVERIAARLQIGHNIAESIAYNMDNATALIAFAFFGHMERFPDLKLVFAHSGISWVWLTLEKAETYLTFFMVKDVALEPGRFFFKRPYLVTFNPWESSIGYTYDVVDSVAAWGSRYPHHDASSALEARQRLEKLRIPADLADKFMGGNAARIFGF
jgi:uncharacterized protein